MHNNIAVGAGLVQKAVLTATSLNAYKEKYSWSDFGTIVAIQ